MPHRFVPTAPRLSEVRYEIHGELFVRVERVLARMTELKARQRHVA